MTKQRKSGSPTKRRGKAAPKAAGLTKQQSADVQRLVIAMHAAQQGYQRLIEVAERIVEQGRPEDFDGHERWYRLGEIHAAESMVNAICAVRDATHLCAVYGQPRLTGGEQ